MTNTHPSVVKTQHLVEGAKRDSFKPECYYLRGLQPKAKTIPTREPYWSAICIAQGDQLQQWERPVIIYTD
eukprot:6198784-Karenia_brevis.AAC.1